MNCRDISGNRATLLEFEHDLMPARVFSVQRNISTSKWHRWDKIARRSPTARKARFWESLCGSFGVLNLKLFNVMQQVRQDYRVSIESFAEWSRITSARQPAGFRLNFFVDEVASLLGRILTVC